jgi:cellulose biosynthesis protein BcsQ
MRVFATYNIKGGVGKTATAVNLAYLSTLSGARTLVWDLDPQGAATFYFRVRAKVKGGAKGLLKGKRELDELIRGTDFEGLDLLPADFSYRNLDLALEATGDPRGQLARLLQPIAETYDHLFLDCAPSISRVSESVFVAADVLLVPTVPTTLSLRTLEQLARHLEKRGPRLRVLPFFCMVDRRKKLHRRITETAEGAPYRFLETAIPYATVVEQMGLFRAPVGAFAWNSPASLAYRKLWEEVLERLGPDG